MQSGQLNAAQFLMSYMDTEQGKLSKKITSSGFSQELKAEQSKLNRNIGDIPESLEGATSGQSASGIETVIGAVGAQSTIWGGREVGSDGDSFGNRPLQKKASPKAKEKVEENLTFANPMVVERIIGQFQVPAEARQACMNASDSDGRIPLKAVTSVLTRKAGPEQAGAAKTQIAAQDVQSLLNSIQNVHPEQSTQLPKLEVKQGGSYTIEEFRELLDRVAQHIADTQSVKQASTGQSTPQQAQATVTAKPGEAVNPSASITPDQVERLTGSFVPSFSKDQVTAEMRREASPSASASPDMVERPTDSFIPSFSKDQVTAEMRREASPSASISPDLVERPTDSFIPSFSRDQVMAEMRREASPSASTSPDLVERPTDSFIPSFSKDQVTTETRREASPFASTSRDMVERPTDSVIPSFSKDQVTTETPREASPSTSTSPDQVERLTASVIPSFSKDQVTTEMRREASPSTSTSPDQVERLTASFIPSFAKEQMAAEQKGLGTIPAYAKPGPAMVKDSIRMEVQPGQEEIGTAETAETEEMVQASLKGSQPMEETQRETRQANGTTNRVNNGIERQSSQPSPREANTIQPAPERPVGSTEQARRFLQVETLGQGSGVTNGPSVNLASSLAPVVDGKVTVIHRSVEESSFNASSEGIAGTDGASARETKVSASQEPDGAGRQGSNRETAGQGPSLSSYEKIPDIVAADQAAREDVSTAQRNFIESNAADSQEIEARNADQVTDNNASATKAQDDLNIASGKDLGGFTRDGAAAGEQGSAFAGRDQGSPTASRGQSWDSSIHSLQRPQETVHATSTASTAGAHSSGGSISLEHPSWPENLSRRLGQLQQEGRNRMTLEVEPRDMGRLSLSIETQKNQVIAYISTDNEQTKALLMQHASDLRQHLQDQGLQLGEFSVEVRKEGNGNWNGYQRKGSTGSQHTRAQTVEGPDTGGASAMAAMYGRRAGEQTISLFA